MSTHDEPTIRIGELLIDRIEEFSAPVLPPDDFLLGLPPDAAERNVDWMSPQHFDAENGLMVMSIHTWVVRAPAATVIIDTSLGNGKERPAFGDHLETDWLQQLEGIGVGVDDVDFVVCTHLHSDHVGWNTTLVDGAWVPTFPNARYLISREEYEFWARGGAQGREHDAAFADSVQPLAEAGQLDLVGPGVVIGGCLTLEAAVGHTPGQLMVRAESDGEVGVFAGDAIHVPLQLAYPDASTVACVDPDGSRRARRALLDDCADDGHLLLSGHFAGPSAFRIERAGDHFAFLASGA